MINTKTPLLAAIIFTSTALKAQSSVDISTSYPLSRLDAATETLTALGGISPTSTGLATSLSAHSWYSVGATPQTHIANVVVVGLLPNGMGSVRHFTREELSSAPYSLVSSIDLGASTAPSGVVYDSPSQKLYIIGRTSGIISCATWDGTSLLSGAIFQPWFDASTLVHDTDPSLLLIGGDASMRFLGPHPRSAAATRIRVGRRVRPEHMLDGSDPWAIVDIATQQQAPFAPATIDGDDFILVEDSFRNGSNSVRLIVGDGQTHVYTLIRSDTGAQLGSAPQISTDREVVINSSEQLQVGKVYGVYRQDRPTDIRSVRCMVRYGEPGAVVSSGLVEMGKLQLSNTLAGSVELNISCPLTSQVGAPVLVVGTVAFGEHGADPIIQVGPQQFLMSNQGFFPLQIRYAEGSHSSWLIYDSFTIPSTPAFVGYVIMFQAVAAELSGGIVFTDILGGMVL